MLLFAYHLQTTNSHCFLFLRLLKCFTSAGALPTFLPDQCRFGHWGFPIRTPPDQRLLATSPKFIAGTPRPSSPFKAKASTIRPYFTRPNIWGELGTRSIILLVYCNFTISAIPDLSLLNIYPLYTPSSRFIRLAQHSGIS